VNSTGARVAWWSVVVLLILGIATATAIGVWQAGRDVTLAPPSSPTEQLREVQERAKTIVPVLLSYTPATVATKADTADPLLTGDFKAEYRKLLEETVAPTAQEEQISTAAQVVGAAVETLTADEASLLVFVDQRVTKPAIRQPELTKSAVHVGLRLVQDEWLVSSFQPV
jgi:Mce-associated membrane protein